MTHTSWPLRLGLVVLTALAGGATIAAAFRVDLGKLASETQQQSPDADTMDFVWWMPVEFWRESIAQNAGSQDETEKLVGALAPYVMIGVAYGAMGPFGGVTWTPVAEIAANAVVIDAAGREYKPLAEDQINPDAKNLAGMLKPVLVNLIGPMGEHFHVFYFPGRDTEGQPLVRATAEGRFSFRVFGNSYVWKTPLTSLMPSKACPVDKEEMSGAWKYCPWHGKELVPIVDAKATPPK